MPQNFWQINYSYRHVNWFVVSIHVLLQLSVFYHHHEQNEASYIVWLSCSKCLLIALCLSDWFASHHTLCLQGWFVQVNQRVLKQRISIMDTTHPKEVASPCKVSCKCGYFDPPHASIYQVCIQRHTRYLQITTFIYRPAFTASFIVIGFTVTCGKVVAANQLHRTACCIQSHWYGYRWNVVSCSFQT